jgi:hypothetical protein
MESNGSGHTMAGCVAVAMAQILKYYNWPPNGFDTVSYTYEGIYPWPYGNIGVNFGNTTYNWQNMPDAISDTNSDLARLIFHTGISVKSIYGFPSGETGAYSASVADAAVRFFRYAYSDINFFYRVYGYTEEEWKSMIKNELDSLRPVLYSGAGINNSGHSFVCDGYNEQDYFHFNFGWNGSYNGNYLLLDISPGNYNFNFVDAVIIGIKPNDGSTIMQDQTWSGNINLQKKHIVLDHTTLNILPGTTVICEPKSSLSVSGILKAQGTITDSIIFTASDTSLRWRGLNLNKGNYTETDTMSLSYCNIEYSIYGGVNIDGLERFNISHCTIRRNKKHCYISENAAQTLWGPVWGGGISITNAKGDISNSLFSENWTWGTGGAIGIDYPDLTNMNSRIIIANNVFNKNSARLHGGGICSYGGSAKISNNTFTLNDGTEGGAIALKNALYDSINDYPLILSNYFQGNSGAFGAGAYIYCSDAFIINNTFRDNNVLGWGGTCLTLISGDHLSENKVINNSMIGGSIGINGPDLFKPLFYNTLIYSGYDLTEAISPQIRIENSNINPIFFNCYIQQDSLDFSGKALTSYFSDTTFYKNNISILPPRLNSDQLRTVKKNSPCIDTGLDEVFPLWITGQDCAGNQRIKRSIDIGACENQSDTIFPTIIENIPAKFSCVNDTLLVALKYRGENVNFRWYINDSLLPECTDDTLLLTLVQVQTDGLLKGLICNSFGSDSILFEHHVFSQLPSEINAIYGPDTLHHFQCSSFSIEEQENAMSYEWVSSSGIKITDISNNRRQVTIEISDTIDHGYLKVRGVNPCGMATNFCTKEIVIDSVPSVLGSFTWGYYNHEPCKNTVFEHYYGFGNPCYDNFLERQWQMPPGIDILWSWDNGGIVRGYVTESAQSGIIRVRWFKEGYGAGEWANYPVTVYPTTLTAPENIIGPDTIAINSTICFRVENNPEAKNYQWLFPTGFVVVAGENTDSVIVYIDSSVQAGEIKVKSINPCTESPFAIDSVFVSSLSQYQIVTNDTVYNYQSKCFNASHTITVAGNGTLFNVQSGGSVTMIAGQNIIFLPTTIVQIGGYLSGYIAPSGPFCATPSIPLAIYTMETPSTNIEKQSFKLFPNPTTGTIILEFEIANPVERVSVDIYGMWGEKILAETLFREHEHEFSLAGKPEGVYFIRITTCDKTETAKIIKQ